MPWWRPAPARSPTALHALHALLPPFLASPPPLGALPADVTEGHAALAQSLARAAALADVGVSSQGAARIITAPARRGVRVAVADAAQFSGLGAMATGAAVGASATATASATADAVTPLRAVATLAVNGALRRPLADGDAAARAAQGGAWLADTVPAWAAEVARARDASVNNAGGAQAVEQQSETLWGRALSQARALRAAGSLSAWRASSARNETGASATTTSDDSSVMHALFTGIAACERARAASESASAAARSAASVATAVSRKVDAPRRAALDAAAAAARADADAAAAVHAAAERAAFAGAVLETALPAELMAAAALLRGVGAEGLPAAAALAVAATGVGRTRGGGGGGAVNVADAKVCTDSGLRDTLQRGAVRREDINALLRELDETGLLALAREAGPAPASSEVAVADGVSVPGAAGKDGVAIVAAVGAAVRTAGWTGATRADVAFAVQGVSDVMSVLAAVLPRFDASEALEDVAGCLR